MTTTPDDQLPTGFSRTGITIGKKHYQRIPNIAGGSFSGTFYNDSMDLYLEGGPLYNFKTLSHIWIEPILLRDRHDNWQGAEGDTLWLHFSGSFTWSATEPSTPTPPSITTGYIAIGTITDDAFVPAPPTGFYTYKVANPVLGPNLMQPTNIYLPR